MNFWQLAFQMEWISTENLRKVVKTEENKSGEITPEEFKNITKEDFVKQQENITK